MMQGKEEADAALGGAEDMGGNAFVSLFVGIMDCNTVESREVKPSADILLDISSKTNMPQPVLEKKQGDICRLSSEQRNSVSPTRNSMAASVTTGDKVQNSTIFPRHCQRAKLVNIRSFMVLEDHAMLVERIYTKYGDISSECKFTTPYIKTALMESIIRIVKLFQQHTACSLTDQDIAFIRNSLGDLELAKFNVQWLKERFNAAVLIPSELAEDLKTHERLCRMISKTETVLKKLKDDCELVSTSMNKKRRLGDAYMEKVLGTDLL